MHHEGELLPVQLRDEVGKARFLVVRVGRVAERRERKLCRMDRTDRERGAERKPAYCFRKHRQRRS
jgi:hypothetical protein